MFLYEMHQHTFPCSACAAIRPEEAVRLLKAHGFAGMVLTNHFYHGNTGIRRQMPWEDFVRPFEEAWLEAKAEGDRVDFDVLFGMEEGVGEGKEVLLYGITPQLLYDHPELRDIHREQDYLAYLAGLVHKAGGVVYQAHPFRVREYILRPWEPLPVEWLDGVEGYNAGNSSLDNARAVQYATQNGLPMIAGTDAHYDETVRFGIAANRRILTNADLLDVLRTEDYTLYREE